MAEAAISRILFAGILRLIAELRRDAFCARPVTLTAEVRLDEGKTTSFSAGEAETGG